MSKILCSTEPIVVYLLLPYLCKAYVCQDKNCHARITVRNVDPDSEGNNWGIYGCLLHQHPLPRRNRSRTTI
jgi:hypothetical protein